jgi:hypothetical protein
MTASEFIAFFQSFNLLFCTKRFEMCQRQVSVVFFFLTLLESYFGIDGVRLPLSRFVDFVRRFEERSI